MKRIILIADHTFDGKGLAEALKKELGDGHEIILANNHNEAGSAVINRGTEVMGIAVGDFMTKHPGTLQFVIRMIKKDKKELIGILRDPSARKHMEDLGFEKFVHNEVVALRQWVRNLPHP